MKKLFLLFLSCSLTACATPTTHPTASGKPEVTIQGAKKSAVKDALVNEMVNYGCNPTRSDDVVVAFDCPIQNQVAAFMFSSKFNSTPSMRATFNLVQTGNAIRVIGDMAAITNPGSGFEQRTDLNRSPDSVKLQYMLIRLRNRFQK